MPDTHFALCDWVVLPKKITKMAYIVVWVHTNVFPSLEDAFPPSISQSKKNCDRTL